MAYSLKQHKAKSINIFFEFNDELCLGGNSSPDVWAEQAKSLVLWLQYALNPANAENSTAIRIKTLVMQVLDEEFNRVKREYDASQATN